MDTTDDVNAAAQDGSVNEGNAIGTCHEGNAIGTCHDGDDSVIARMDCLCSVIGRPPAALCPRLVQPG